VGILGTPIGSLLCYLWITVLNLFAMGRVLEHPPAIVKNALRSCLAAALMGVLTYGAWYGLTALGITSRVILCGAPIAVGVVVYVVCVVLFKVLTREDCLLLPKGAKIAKILKL
jgi:stage V sporulation protein B